MTTDDGDKDDAPIASYLKRAAREFAITIAVILVLLLAFYAFFRPDQL